MELVNYDPRMFDYRGTFCVNNKAVTIVMRKFSSYGLLKYGVLHDDDVVEFYGFVQVFTCKDMPALCKTALGIFRLCDFKRIKH